MPYKGSPCGTPTNNNNTASTKVVVGADSRHTEGADLLLSLAETASEHAKNRHDSSCASHHPELASGASLPTSPPAKPEVSIASSPLEVSTTKKSLTTTTTTTKSSAFVTDSAQDRDFSSTRGRHHQVQPVTPSPLAIHRPPGRETSTSSSLSSSPSSNNNNNNMHMSLHGSGTHMLVPSPIKLPKKTSSSEQRDQPEPDNHRRDLDHAFGTKRKPMEQHQTPQRTASASSEEAAPQPVSSGGQKKKARLSSPTTQEPLHNNGNNNNNGVISPSSSQDGQKSPQSSGSGKSPLHPSVPPHPTMYRVSAPPPPHYHPGYGPPPPPQPWMHHHAPFYHHPAAPPPPHPAYGGGGGGYYAVTVHPMPPPQTGSYTAAQQQQQPPPPHVPRMAVATKPPVVVKQQQPSEEWQQKKPKNVGNKARCVPLKQPTKSRVSVPNPEEYDANLPDFPLLVNFPEHLTRGQTRGTGEHKGLAPEGQRHCVMCGKLRICSSSANRLNRSTAPSDNDSTVHIIPRQNKGVCTACDVTVWSVQQQRHNDRTGCSGSSDDDNYTTTTDPLEIKWCKGCKNFRPWPAFGEKGLATKCARCRHRQREKYAMQKRQNKAATSYDFQKEDDILAAQGLSNLMHAQNA